MTKSRMWLALCLATFALSGLATAQTNSATELLNSPVKVEVADYGPTVVRSAPWNGSANFGICEDISDNTLWGTDLYTGIVNQYDKALNLVGGFNSGLVIQVGIAYDHVADTFWIMDPIVVGAIVEYDKTGVATGNQVPLTAILPLGGLPGPLTIDPAAPTVTWWLEDIGVDTVFEIDAAGAILNSHLNPDDTGSGAYGNGLSYDAFDSFSPPANLHLAAGLISEGRVSRIYEGQPSAAFPRLYQEVIAVGTFDSFINGIQNTVDATASPDEVWYLQANSSNTIIEVNLVPIPAIIQCAPGGVNLGTQAPTPVFFDDMESGELPHWSHGAAVGVDDWAIVSTPNAQSPVNAWFAVDDVVITDKYLDLTVDVAAPATELSFWHTFDFEGFFDGAQILASTDGGSNFNLLDSEILVGGYTGTFSTCCGNPAGGTPGWGNGAIGPMTEVVVDMSGYQGTGIVIRFRLICDSSFGDDGWFIDDVGLREPSGCDGNLAQVLFVNRDPSSTTVFLDDMESGVEEPWWSHGAAIGIDDWAIRSTPYASSPTNAWTCIDDTTYTDKYLDLTFDLTAPDTELRFKHTFYLENTFDGVNLSISTDGGANFTLLDSEILEGGYTDIISTSFGSPIGGQPAWSGETFGAMTTVRVDLSGYAPAPGAIVRWRFGGDSCCGPGSNGGYQLDDVEYGRGPSTGTGDEDYTIELTPTTPLSFRLDEPPSRQGDGSGTNACIYAWNAEPGDSDIVIVPKGLGPMCFGVYSQPPTRMPKKIFNGIGAENKLGPNQSPTPPGIPEGGDFEFAKRASGTGHPVTATLQGIIEDNCSQGTKPYSVTNGVLLKVQ